MFDVRITDPSFVSREMIVEIIARHDRPIVQFSRSNYDAGLMTRLNELCAEFGDRIDVRFFGHYPDPNAFDAAVLDHLPDVRSLIVDCLTSIVNEDAICRLALTRLSFGVYRFDRPDFLRRLDIGALRRLTLAETKKRNFDLAPLAMGAWLEHLFIQGHTKHIDSIAGLPRLGKLTLCGMSNKTRLDFLNGLASLRALTLLLGGRDSIAEFEHVGLEELSILRVRGFAGLGAIGRLPRLRMLHIEDQLQLQAIDVAGAPLRALKLVNCKQLEQIDGLDTLSELIELRVGRTKLDLDALMMRSWPDTLKIFALYGCNRTWNKKTRARLDSRGFHEFAQREQA